jgi:hypothetical protein
VDKLPLANFKNGVVVCSYCHMPLKKVHRRMSCVNGDCSTNTIECWCRGLQWDVDGDNGLTIRELKKKELLHE